MSDLIERLAATDLNRFLASNPLAFPAIEIVHVIAVSLVLGAVFVFDLRLIGWSWREWPATRLLATLRPIAIVGFGGAVASGFLLFMAQPVAYAANLPFRIKLVLLAIAGLNVLAFHLGFARAAEADAPISRAARVSALVSLVLWTAILLAGRFIGFMLFG